MAKVKDVAAATTEQTEVVNAQAAPAKVEPTSEKLQQLESQLAAARAAIKSAAINDATDDEIEQLTLATVKLKGEIKAEQRNLAAAEVAAAIAEKRNARVKLITDYKDAAIRFVETGNDEDYERQQAAFEILLNIVLGSTPSAPRAKAESNGQTSGAPRGGITAEIRALLPGLYAKGLDGRAVRAYVIKEHVRENGVIGYNDGTANAAILAYEKENGIA